MRESGYAVTIRGFIAVSKSDLDRQIAAATAMKKALDGDPADMMAMLKIDPDGIMQKFTTRNPLENGAADANEPELEFEDHSIGSAKDTDVQAGNGVPGQPGADTRKRASRASA